MGAAASAQQSIEMMQEIGVEECRALIRNKDHLLELWKRMDVNGNGKISLAEIDKMVVELSDAPGPNQHLWASFNNKPALLRAYKFTTFLDGKQISDAYVHRNEFVALLRNLFFFSKLCVALISEPGAIFDAMDIEDDRRINGPEFQAGLRRLGFNLSENDVRTAFDEMDTNDGGQILFDEFCAYCIKATECDDENVGIVTIIQDSDSDAEDDDGLPKRKRKQRQIDTGTVADYQDILGTFNPETGQWEGFAEDTCQPTMQDLKNTMTQVKEQSRLDREDSLRLQMGLPPDGFE